MKEYRITIRRRMVLRTGTIILAVILGAYRVFATGYSVESNMSDGIIVGFQLGLIFGIGIIALTQLIRLRKALKDETELKRLYHRENDERLKAIRSKAGMPMLIITSVMMLIAAIIAGYINIVIFYTLTITAIVQLLIGAIVKLYCYRTM